ncbi:MAG: hypothetical protein IKJ80_07475 [Clostridia bacterium]|nr:hypothetical protein [Clostridia bacterium]
MKYFASQNVKYLPFGQMLRKKVVKASALTTFVFIMLFASQKASSICANGATSLGASPHHLPKATSLRQSRTSFAPQAQSQDKTAQPFYLDFFPFLCYSV